MTEDGGSLGVMPTQQAQELADREELDLVEVVPTAQPPVCRIMDFGKYRFEQKKKIKDQKSKTKPIHPKEIRLRPVSDDHDVSHKIEQLKKFLAERRSVTVNVVFKKRESMYKEQGSKIVEKILAAIQEFGTVDHPPKFEGKSLSVRVRPKN